MYKTLITMKKTILLSSLILLLSLSYGQRGRRGQTIKWFSLAAKAGVGNTIFFNKDVSADQNASMNYLTIGYSVGGRFTFSYGEKIGVGLDVLYSGFGQKYELINIQGATSNYDKEIKLSSLDIIPFVRYTGKRGYFEAGPKFSNIKSHKEINSVDIPGREHEAKLMFDTYKPKFTSIMLGGGIALARTERINFNLGLRVAYSFGDLMVDQTQYVLDDGLYVPDYTPTSSTNPFSAQIVLEVNYFFAFWGNAACKRGRLVFFQ